MFKHLSLPVLVKIDSFVHRHAWIPGPVQRAICDVFDWEISGGEVGRRVWLLS